MYPGSHLHQKCKSCIRNSVDMGVFLDLDLDLDLDLNLNLDLDLDLGLKL